jgi:MFS family permease
MRRATIFKTRFGAPRTMSPVARYLGALGERDFRRLFFGATASSLGDGMSLVAMAWLVVDRPNGTTQLGVLMVLYTAPVVVGGWLAGLLLDRFDRRHVIAVDSLIRGTAFASVPMAMVFGVRADWQIFAVAAIYGLLKMIPLAGLPSAIPDLVSDAHLDAANALEGLSYGIAGIMGPAAAGLLIGLVGAANVMLADALSYFLFAGMAVAVRRPLLAKTGYAGSRASLPVVLKFLATDAPIAATTLAFMAFNVAEGMLLVTGPWLAREKLGGAAALGLLLSALSAGELAGAAAAGAWSPRRPLLGIGGVELFAGAGFAFVLASLKPAVAAGYLIVGFFSAPMTVWAQSMRMRRLPPDYRGRAFATLRTLMQATPPLGAAMAAQLLAGKQLSLTVQGMVLLVVLPALAVAALGVTTPRNHGIRAKW